MGINNGPTNDTTMKKMTARNPMKPTLLWAIRRRVVLRLCQNDAMLLASCHTHARIEPAVQEFGQKVRENDGDGNDQENALHHRIVSGLDAAQQELANPLVDEDELDE